MHTIGCIHNITAAVRLIVIFCIYSLPLNSLWGAMGLLWTLVLPLVLFETPWGALGLPVAPFGPPWGPFLENP